jgi:trans-2,3-dihydro-3-hydroxyanthranilate isomerase
VSAELARLAAFDARAASPAGAGGRGAPYVVLDVFTDTQLEGNPVAVFTDAAPIAELQMGRIARELNLSESVFVLPAQADGDVRVRIFTPTVELPFAGHPVLGCAIVLGQALARERVTLETAAGSVPLELWRQRGTAWGRMSQPLPSWEPFAQESALLDALGVRSSALPVELYSNGPRFVYVALTEPEQLSALRPDTAALCALEGIGVACFAPAGARWRMRMFAPALGVVEDPATGSAAGPLAVHLSRHGRIGFGAEVEIEQGMEIGRPSLLRARASGSAQRLERVEVWGAAVIVARGELLLGG